MFEYIFAGAKSAYFHSGTVCHRLSQNMYPSYGKVFLYILL